MWPAGQGAAVGPNLITLLQVTFDDGLDSHLWRVFKAENCPASVSLVKFLRNCHEPKASSIKVSNCAGVLV
jgi:hypothetical protein